MEESPRPQSRRSDRCRGSLLQGGDFGSSSLAGRHFSGAQGSSELLVVFCTLVGISDTELRHRFIESGAVAQVSIERTSIAGTRMSFGQQLTTDPCVLQHSFAL